MVLTESSIAPAITPPFTFSQSSLIDFDRCPRLFWLRHIEHLEWPATAASRERELLLRERKRFHRLLHQHFLGVDVEPVIDAEPAGSSLREWWAAFQQFPPAGLDGEAHPEVTLGAPLVGHWLTARCDLLAVKPAEMLTIVDWKTGRPSAGDTLREGWQTVVYQYVLAVAGAPYWDGRTPAPEDIRMLYWFADYPASPAILAYDAARHEEAERRLAARMIHIASLSPADFAPCEDEQVCHFCGFQSYCRRVPERTELPDDAYSDTDEWDWSDVPEYEY